MNVLITGVSSGIGRGLTEWLLQNGHRVAGCSRRSPSLEHECFSFAELDVTDAARVAVVVPELAEQLKSIDVAILNAGVLGEIQDMREATLEAMRHTMEVNLWANKTLIDQLAQLSSPPRQIVTMSSGAAVNGNRGWNGYAISKAALNMLTKLYADELPEIHFAALAPGLVDTAMQDYLCGLEDESQRFASLETIKSKRDTEEMPDGQSLAPRLWDAITRLPQLVDSGEFVDIRKPPLAGE